jgi:RNA polymerase sigma factor (sigma-70 family)
MNVIDAQTKLAMNDGATETPGRRARAQLTKEQQALAAKFMPLAISLARSYRKFWVVELEEFMSAASMALVEAAQSYDPNRKVKFATFARFRIVGALQSVLREYYASRHVRELPNIRTICFVPGMEERGQLMLTTPDAPVNRLLDDVEEVEHWFDKLPSRHAMMCRQLYIEDKSQVQVAQKLGCSKSRVCTIHSESIEILRSFYEVQEAAIERGMDVRRN